jgi:hypothetical protein
MEVLIMEAATEQEKKAPITITTKALADWLKQQDEFYTNVIDLRLSQGMGADMLVSAIVMNRLVERFSLPEDYKLSEWRYAMDGESNE